MKYNSVILILIICSMQLITLFGDRANASENWKGDPRENYWNIGAMYGTSSTYPGYRAEPMGMISFKIDNKGFLPDINNQIFIEGRYDVSTSTSLFNSNGLNGKTNSYNFAFRWDIQKNNVLTYFVLLNVFNLTTVSYTDPTGNTSPYSSNLISIGSPPGIGLFYRPFETFFAFRLQIDPSGAGVGLSFDF